MDRHSFKRPSIGRAEDSGLATSGDAHSCELDYQDLEYQELNFPGFVQTESPAIKGNEFFQQPKVTPYFLLKTFQSV